MSLVFDGATVSLDPSVGNWSFPCRSHYWIRQDRVHWAPKWSPHRISEGRAADREAKHRHMKLNTNELAGSRDGQGSKGLVGWLKRLLD